MPVPETVRVTALYHFTDFSEPAALRGPLTQACEAAGIKGTLLLAHEGINGTIAGSEAGIDEALAAIRALPGCAALDIKNAYTNSMPFHRMKVRLKAEIVSMGVEGLDPAHEAGTYVEPEDWNALISDPETIVIDTRNDYEVRIGTFRGAIDPETASFRDFPAWFRARREEFSNPAKPPRIAMFCTGGIRCEKATAFLKAEGVAGVHHLKGGILRYLETVPPEQSLWDGECFVFDQRVSVGHGLVPGKYDLCHACRRPVSPDDQLSPLFERGVRCPACAAERQEEQRQRYAERQRQVDLAAARGAGHLGAQPPAASKSSSPAGDVKPLAGSG